MCVKAMASQTWNIFETYCRYITRQCWCNTTVTHHVEYCIPQSINFNSHHKNAQKKHRYNKKERNVTEYTDKRTDRKIQIAWP